MAKGENCRLQLGTSLAILVCIENKNQSLKFLNFQRERVGLVSEQAPFTSEIVASILSADT
jgi:hypothetical protein